MVYKNLCYNKVLRCASGTRLALLAVLIFENFIYVYTLFYTINILNLVVLTLARLPRHASHKRDYVNSSNKKECSTKDDGAMNIEHDSCG